MSGFLLDTNVISEIRRPSPSAAVVRWFATHDEGTLFLPAITFGEIRKGIERMESGRRRHALESWLDTELPTRFAGRILDFDRAAALIWGRVLGAAENVGRPLDAIDAQIAAIALRDDLTLATGNTADFVHTGVSLTNPWRDEVS